MRKRDLEILKLLEAFRCLSRDHIACRFFNQNQASIKTTNMVMKRLVRDGYVKAHTRYQPYVYSLSDEGIRINSQKILHFLGLYDCYCLFQEELDIDSFVVEPKYAKGYMEPDGVMTLSNGCSFFVEYQQKIYSQKEMRDKLDRYDAYYRSKEWEREATEFPPIWFVSRFEIRNIPEGYEHLTILQKRLPERTPRYELVSR